MEKPMDCISCLIKHYEMGVWSCGIFDILIALECDKKKYILL